MRTSFWYSLTILDDDDDDDDDDDEVEDNDNDDDNNDKDVSALGLDSNSPSPSSSLPAYNTCLKKIFFLFLRKVNCFASPLNVVKFFGFPASDNSTMPPLLLGHAL